MKAETIFTASAENVKHLGRTYYKEGKLYCSLSGSGAEFFFTGSKCQITISGDENSGNDAEADSHARLGIYVDGERVIDDMLNQKTKIYNVFESETEKTVTVSVVKLTEAPMSYLSIDNITTDSLVITPTPDKDFYLEIVGDSITCGYGVDDPVAEHAFSTKTEDVTKSYSYKTAQALDADYSMVSFSGFGIISGYTDNGQKLLTHLVPPLYTKLGALNNKKDAFKPYEIDWNFSKRQPDMIVINLGTNDDSYTQDNLDRQEDYRVNYTAFLKTVRANNPNAKILCVLGIMGDRLFKFLETAVQNYISETGDTNIDTMKFDVQLEVDGYSADYHPSILTHDKATQKLVEKIKCLRAEPV